MRLPARTLLVLVLCLAALVGASAQASYFSSFFSGKRDGSGEDGEDGEDALLDATRLEEDNSVDAKLRALMADAASFGADADGIRDADFEAEEDAFLLDALVDEDGGVELPVFPPAPPPLKIPRDDQDDARVEEGGASSDASSHDVGEKEEAREAKEDDEALPAPTQAEDDADVFARMAKLEAELLVMASEDDILEEWLDAGGDGEEAPRVRAPRTLLTPRDDEDEDEDVQNGDVQNVDKKKNANVKRRALLASSVSGDNTLWVAFEDMPARLSDPRSGPETRVASDHGEAYVTRAGGYWQAARFNRVERPTKRRLPKNFGAGSGEGVLNGPKGGINQHDRIGINKASGWPGVLNAGKVSTEKYPGVPTRDILGSLQPFVTSVTSYSPDARSSSFAYRNKARLSKLWCLTGLNSRSCSDTSVYTTAPHDFKAGDEIYFETVYGADKDVLLEPSSTYVVNSVSDDSMSFTTIPAIDSSSAPLNVDVTYATVLRKKKRTRVNPEPPYAPRDYAYEGGDQVYFFVTFNEAVAVSGSPTLTLRTGDHFEPGAVNGVARFVGGGFGEKKTFWKNDERSPIKSSLSSGGNSLDPLHVHDGGCTLRNPHNDGSLDSDCVLYSEDDQTCDCAQYSGITRSGDAQLRTRRVHTFKKGDVVEVKGVVGSDAGLINKRHAIGTVSGTGTSGNNLMTFEPPLNLTGRAFDASKAVVFRVNEGNECRAESAGVLEPGERAHGAGFCVFGSEADAFDERRREQFMDNVLAFALYVNTTGDYLLYENYDQSGSTDGGVTGSGLNPPTPHLAFDLEYASTEALSVDGSMGVAIKRACVDAFTVTQVECGAFVTVTVRGKHRLLPGDYVRLEGVGDVTADGVSDAFLSKWNAEHKVHALPADAGIAINRLDWNTIWDASPYWGDDVSKFQIALNATNGRGICDARGGQDGASPPSVVNTVARKTRDANALYSSAKDSGRRCVFADADVSLPKPGDALFGLAPYAGSLSFNKDITLGRPFVVNVTARAVAGSVFGHNGGGGVPPNERLTATRNVFGPDVLRIVVSFSEPVLASCGTDDDEWATIEQSPGLRLVACRSVRLRLKTSPDDALAGSANYESTTGVEGEEIFPTGFMARRDAHVDKENEVVFLYLPRRRDNCTGETIGLQYFDEFALEVGCAVYGAGGACDSRSHIRRRSDNVLASTRLPPTRRDAGRCVHGPDSNGVAQCASATADHTRSLLGTTPVLVDAVF